MDHHNYNTEPLKPSSELPFKDTFLFLFNQLKQFPFSIAVVIFFSLLAALGELMSIAMFLPILESLRPDAAMHISDKLPIGFLAKSLDGYSVLDKIRLIAILLLVVEAVKAVARYISGRMSFKFKIKVDKNLRMLCLQSLMQAGLKYIHKEKIANLFTIINNFTGNTSQVILLVVMMIPDLFLALACFAILLSISLKMTVITLVLSIITTWGLGGLTKFSKRLGSEANRAAIILNHIGFEVLSGLSLIRIFAGEKKAEEKFERAVDDVQDTTYKRGLLEAAISPLATTMLMLIVVIVLLASTYLMNVETEYWLEMLSLFLVVFSRLGGPLGRINLQRTQIFSNAHAILMVQNFINEQDKEVLVDGTRQIKELDTGIEFDHVHFGYEETEEEVLTDLSFTIAKDKMTAIVGGSGSGKSTLMSLIPRLYDVSAGRILIDGVPIQDYEMRTWRTKIGVVTQNTVLFNESILANIKFGKSDASMEEVIEAARQANAYNFIMKMRDKFETIVGDRGIRLSGGQAQRIALARAMLIQPQILLLDEATSALDTQSERLVQNAIDNVSRNRTVVVVAHRLSTIKNADKIIVLEDGKIVEEGSHAELMKIQSHYWGYVQMQDLQVDDKVADQVASVDILDDEPENGTNTNVPGFPEMN